MLLISPHLVYRHILVVDNQDSFVYNLIEILRHDPTCYYTVAPPSQQAAYSASDFDGLLLSPGPACPEDFPEMMRLLAEADAMPAELAPSIFGVCLGHQAIAIHYGAHLRQMPHPAHGVASALTCPSPRSSILPPLSLRTPQVGRYHSWVVDAASCPDTLRITAYDEEGEVMALEHHARRVYGVQFHPESIITEEGVGYLRRWLQTCHSR